MRKSLVVVLGVVVAAAAMAVAASAHDVPFTDKDLESEESMWSLYERWRSVYASSSSSGDLAEKVSRFEVFKKNARYIHEFNKRKGMSYWLGLNKFADMTSEEFMAKYTGAKVDDTGVSGAGAASEAEEEQLLVGDVGLEAAWCWSCWAFSAVGAVEGINAIMTGNLLTLSEQQVLDCFGAGDCSGGWPDQAQQYIVLDCFGAGDCSGGWPDQAQQYIVKNGITLDRCGKEPYYPAYDATKHPCRTEPYYPAYDATKHPCRTVAGKQPIITVDDVKWVNKSEAALLLKVYQQPISVALDASGCQRLSLSPIIFT
uniref:Cathepsin propeptide inhibitor domain-containing protein n=1 Tax=Oryza meridionalis TaxID=40149 RepID=A0A0E0C6X2_9ORYZ